MTTIATHNGICHADDVFGTAALKLVYPDAAIVRTRDRKVLAAADFRVDVGGKDDPRTGDYDHHQRGGAGSRDNGVPFAAFGLVWKAFGEVICGSKEIADLVDRQFVAAIDAADTAYPLTETVVEGATPNTLSGCFASMNPSWHETGVSVDEQFERSLPLAKLFLERAIVRASGILLAEAVTREAVANSDGGPVVILEKFCPWQGVVIKEAPNALFIVFPAITGDWRIQCIPPSLGSRDKRKPLPAAWGGLAGEALQSESGVDDAVFCHVGLFIGGASTREGALALAELAVQA
jgi:uncharacterized UPF0160 family protein